jgi:hypothetical protein
MDMQKTNAFCSIGTVNYLAQASVLDDSLKRAGHTEPHYTLVADYSRSEYEAKFASQISPANNILVFLSDLEIPHVMDMVERYNAFEFTNALKPFFMKWLLRNHPEIEMLVYLDTDIMVYGRFDDLFTFFKSKEDASVVLTPHLYDFETYKAQKYDPYFFEKVYMEYGPYNGGFYVVKNDTLALQFLDWHATQLFTYGYDAKDQAMFVDQKILDFAVMLFSFIIIYRNNTYNLAHWNFRPGLVRKYDDTIFVGKSPLVFFHFSKYNAVPAEAYAPYVLGPEDLKIFYEMVDDYKSRLKARGHLTIKNIPYGFVHDYKLSKKDFVIETQFTSTPFARLYRGLKLLTTSPKEFSKRIYKKLHHRLIRLKIRLGL